jgi:hypothetical protein
MIVRIFKTNQVYIFAFIPLVLLLLRWPALIGEAPFTSSGQLPFLTDFFAWLSGYAWLSLLLSIVAITYQAYILSDIANEHRLLPYSSNLYALILALLYSVFSPQDWFSPAIFANVFSVLALKRIMDIFHQGGIQGNLFRAGIYIGIASILYLPSTFMLLILFYDLAIIRTFHWREYVIPVLGILLVYIYLLAYFFLRTETEIMANYFMEPKTFLTFLDFKLINWMPAMVVIIITALSFIFLLTTGSKRTVRQNNLFKVVGITFVMTFALSMIYSKDFMSATTLIWPSLTMVTTYYLLGIKKKWMVESLVYLLVISILFRDLWTLL